MIIVLVLTVVMVAICAAFTIKYVMMKRDTSDAQSFSVLKNFFKLEPETLKCSGDNDKQTRHKFLSEVTYRDLNCEVAECSDQCRCSLNRYYRYG